MIGGRPNWTWPPADRIQADTADLVALRDIARSLPRLARRSGGEGGSQMARTRGRGMEFAETRPYQAGDDVRHIDWRVTARSTHTHTKLFQEERERPVLLWVDYRASMFFATRGVFKAALAARAAAILAWRGALTGNRAGGLIFSAEREQLLRPRRGPAAALHLARGLATAPWQDHAGPATIRIADTLDALRRMARPGSSVALLSDFREFDRIDLEPLHRIGRHCDLLLLRLFDPIEAQLPPPGLYPIGDGRRRWLLDSRDPALRAAHRQRFQALGERLRELASATRALLLECATDSDPLPLLRQACAGRWL